MHVSFSVEAERDLRILILEQEVIMRLLKFNERELISAVSMNMSGIMEGDRYRVVFHRPDSRTADLVVDNVIPEKLVFNFS